VHPPASESAAVPIHDRPSVKSLAANDARSGDDQAPASRPAPLSMRSSLREAPSSRDAVPPSSRSEAALRASREALQNLAPGLTSKLNLAADCLLVVAAAALSSAGRNTLQHTAWVTLIALGVWIVGARTLRHYDAWSEGLFGELAVTSVLVVSVGVSLQIFNQVSLGHALHAGVGTFLLLSWPGVWFVRATVVAFRAWRHAPPEHVLIIGTGPLGRVTGEDIRDTSKHRQVFGYLSWKDDTKQRRLPATVLGRWDDLEICLKQNAIGEVYVAGNPAKNGEAMQAAIRTCERFGVPFALPAYGFRLSRARPVNGRGFRDGYMHFLNIEHKPVQKVFKRLFDIAASAFALWVLSPLILVTAMLIKLTSRGPIFFKQERVGMHGKAFYMLKFRSMVANAEELKLKLLADNEQNGPVFKIKKDPRITAVGRFIRKFSVDELPQLINVLRGEMSIVGPRPPLPTEVAQYEPWQRRRLSVRPGLTCLWQVSGRNKVGFQDWMYLDMQYIDHWSLGQDFNLILKTVPVVLTGKGAS
jgi:exopolysaccharide biosynthesis polyprenyl glycosylphosphotransferase